MAVHFKFAPVELGAGWTSIEASGSGGPIVLIEGRSATTGVIVKSRLDTETGVHRPQPLYVTLQADPETVRHLGESVTGAADSATPADLR